MHELAIAEALANVTLRHAAGRRVTAVHVRVGPLRQVVPAALELAFALVVDGTTVAGATLEIEATDAVGRCRDCGADSVLVVFPLSCSACGGVAVDVVRGEELSVDWVEVEDPDEGRTTP